MYYGEIREYDIANGEGVRITLFVSGCTNHCRGCFQPETWSFTYGRPYTEETERHILDFLKNPLVDGLTLLGGEPMEPENQPVLLDLCRKVKSQYPEKNIWAFTGFVLENDLLAGQRRHTASTDELLTLMDILVDGPFILEKRNLALSFRGSENQRVLDLPRTLAEGRPVLKIPVGE